MGMNSEAMDQEALDQSSDPSSEKDGDGSVGSRTNGGIKTSQRIVGPGQNYGHRMGHVGSMRNYGVRLLHEYSTPPASRQASVGLEHMVDSRAHLQPDVTHPAA